MLEMAKPAQDSSSIASSPSKFSRWKNYQGSPSPISSFRHQSQHFPVLVDVSFPKRADSCNVIIKGYDLAGVTSGVDQSYIKWVKNSETTEFPEFSICMRFLVFLIVNPVNKRINKKMQTEVFSIT